MSSSIQPIGWIRSPFKEKFGAPRQAREVPDAEGLIHFYPDFCIAEAFREIESFSHLWILFHFHQTTSKGWSPTIRPPRLGGNKRVGVFASRSPFRPNSIGMSAVINRGLVQDKEHGLSLKVKGLDIIDSTPILDIKPYLAHCDSIPDARNGYSPEKINPLAVIWNIDYQDGDKLLIEQTLALDPTPGYQSDDKTYGITIQDKNVVFRRSSQSISIERVES